MRKLKTIFIPEELVKELVKRINENGKLGRKGNLKKIKLKKLKKRRIAFMKRSIIILLVLITFFAIPALASTPKPENAPAPTSEDTMFLGWQLLSDEELIGIIGNIVNSGAQQDLWQEAKTQGRDEMLILLAMWREANQKYWNPKVNKFAKSLIKLLYIYIPATCFGIFGSIPEGVAIAAQNILESVGIDLTLSETANLLGLIAACAYTEAVNLLIDLIIK